MVHASEAATAVTFSDTIVLFTKSASDTELRSIIILMTELLHEAAGSSLNTVRLDDKASKPPR